jgi:hypothetical protein
MWSRPGGLRIPGLAATSGEQEKDRKKCRIFVALELSRVKYNVCCFAGSRMPSLSA